MECSEDINYIYQQWIWSEVGNRRMSIAFVIPSREFEEKSLHNATAAEAVEKTQGIGDANRYAPLRLG